MPVRSAAASYHGTEWRITLHPIALQCIIRFDPRFSKLERCETHAGSQLAPIRSHLLECTIQRCRSSEGIKKCAFAWMFSKCNWKDKTSNQIYLFHDSQVRKNHSQKNRGREKRFSLTGTTRWLSRQFCSFFQVFSLLLKNVSVWAQLYLSTTFCMSPCKSFRLS